MTSILVAAHSSTARVAPTGTDHEWFRADLILDFGAFDAWLDRDPWLYHWCLKLLYTHELPLVLFITTTIADVFGFTSVDDYSLSILQAALHIVNLLGYATTMTRRYRPSRFLIYLSVACIYFQKDAFSITICQILSTVAQRRLFITTIFLLLIVRVVLDGEDLADRWFIDGLLLLTLDLSLLLESCFFCYGVVDEGAPLLQPHNALVQVSLMEMSACIWTHILFLSFTTTENFPQFISINWEWHGVIQTDQLLRLNSISTTVTRHADRFRTIQTLHSMYTYEVSHASVHLFAIKELESEIVVWG